LRFCPPRTLSAQAILIKVQRCLLLAVSSAKLPPTEMVAKKFAAILSSGHM
jgi:hypothetical protein